MAEDPRCWGCYQMRNRTCLPQCPFAPVFPPPSLPQDAAAFSRYISRYQPIHMGDTLVRIDDLQTKHMYINMLDFEIDTNLADMAGGTLALINHLNAQIHNLNNQIFQLNNQVANLEGQLENHAQVVQVLTNARDEFVQQAENMEEYEEDLIVVTESVQASRQNAQASAQVLTDFIAELNNQ